MQSSQSSSLEGAQAGDEAGRTARLRLLTDKQRAVLDLLVQFKTSKEISRILEISPHTVDQRVEAAKNKLGAVSRAELALVYRQLLGASPVSDPSPVSERVTYEDSYVAEPLISPQQSSAVGTVFAPPNDPEPSNDVVPDTYVDLQVVPEVFDGRWGTVARLATIVAIAALFCIAFLGGLAIFVQLSNLLRR